MSTLSHMGDSDTGRSRLVTSILHLFKFSKQNTAPGTLDDVLHKRYQPPFYDPSDQSTVDKKVREPISKRNRTRVESAQKVLWKSSISDDFLFKMSIFGYISKRIPLIVIFRPTFHA